MKNEMKAYLNEIIDEVISIRRRIHENPETSNNEYETSKLIYELLEENGFRPEYIKDKLGVTAVIEGINPGPTIAYRADMDALKIQETTDLDFRSKNENISHSCGHDIHTSVLLGTAFVLKKFKKLFNGSIRLIFQIGEETFTGAKQAIEKNLLDHVDYILSMHTWPDLPAGTIGLKKGAMMASSSNVNFKVIGKGGHAAHPHKGVDPVIVSAHIMTAIQSIVSRNIAPIDSAVITFGKLTAGTASNIIPSEATAEGTVRTLDADVDQFIEKRIQSIVVNQAKSFGATGEVEFNRIALPVINDDSLVDLLDASSENSIGSENIRWLENPSMGSEDFSFYLQQVPGALIRLGTSNSSEQTQLPLHNSSLVFDENAIETGICFMSNAILYLLKNI